MTIKIKDKLPETAEDYRALDFLINEDFGRAWRVTLDKPGFVGEYVRGYNPEITSSLDHVLELVEEVLPGWKLLLNTGTCSVQLAPDSSFSPDTTFEASAITLPIAVLVALYDAIEDAPDWSFSPDVEAVLDALYATEDALESVDMPTS